MTSGSLYFNLLKEDFKRRLWAVALVFLAFFFTLPIGLALGMENAANTNYYIYNDYTPLIQDGTMTDIQYQAKVLELKREVVVRSVEYGNGMIALLMIAAAVVVGVSSFAYLHNRKKVDFYHSIPVRRETLFTAQFTGGIFIVAAAYAVNLLLLLGVSMSYGVSSGSILGTMAGGWALNMLYYALMYAVAVAAMMMTGNIVVGVLGTAVFFFLLPSVMMVLSGYCENFFVTTARYMWSSDGSPFMWGTKYLSPFSVYINSFGWNMKEMSKYVPELICTVLALLAVSVLDLGLYRRRPSEAAGKAMAFKRSMSPIRILIVLTVGMSGGLFFWTLQSRLRWGLFGTLVSVLLAHCIIEIIYHFDFKKMFSHRLQLGLCLAAGVLLFLSFRFDWYGYDSYVPSREKIASVSLDIDSDSNWLSSHTFNTAKDGRQWIEYEEPYKYIEENMTLTDLETVMPIVEEGRRRALEERNDRLGGNRAVAVVRQNSAVSYIGGADGPTSVFLASQTGGEDDGQAERFNTSITVCYRLSNGRVVRRSYTLPLSAVMDSYKALYSEAAYKDGLYGILSLEAGTLNRVMYKEGGRDTEISQDSRVLEAMLKAYQEDLRELTVEERLAEMPVGGIAFMTNQDEAYYRQQRQAAKSAFGGWVRYQEDILQYWPVYPSFDRTIGLLDEQGLKAGSFLTPEQVERITYDVQNFFYEKGGQLPEGDELEALIKLNPYYNEEGTLVFEDAETIRTLMAAIAEEDSCRMNYLCETVSGGLYGNIKMINSAGVSGLFVRDKVTPEIEELFKGIPYTNQN